MSLSEDTLWCSGCGTEIIWVPYVIDDQYFCCQDCAHGLSCDCSNVMDWEEEYRDTSTTYPGY